MPDCVLDATVVAMANGDIAGRKPGNAFDRRLVVIEQLGSGAFRLRYNSKLREEYLRIVREYRNDVIDLFFIVLTERAYLVGRNTLSRQNHATARTCEWPGHDQHLLAAALGGVDPLLFVTEQQHSKCGRCILRRFAIHVEDLG
jgi:hypothetical protein